LFSGLVLSWFGDYFLMGIGPGGFLSGLTAFLLAHLAYSIAFLIAGIRVRRSLIAFGALTIFGSCVAAWIFPGVPATLRFPVGAYMLVISAMVSLALGIEGVKSRALVIGGALLFYASDLFVARAFFVHPGFVNTLIGLPLYYSGQVALAMGGGRTRIRSRLGVESVSHAPVIPTREAIKTIMFERLIVNQLKHPHGWIGRYLLPILWNRRNAALNESALIRLRLEAGDRVLDVGFGGGYLIDQMLAKIPKGHVSGIDASEVMVEQGRRRFAKPMAEKRLDLQCALADSLPYSNEHFHKVVSVNSLFYWPDLRKGLSEIYRVLTDKGVLVLVYTCRRDLDKRGFSSYGVRSFEDGEVTSVLRECGFRGSAVEREADRHREYSIIIAEK